MPQGAQNWFQNFDSSNSQVAPLLPMLAHVPARLQAVWAEVGQLDRSSYQNSETSFVLLMA